MLRKLQQDFSAVIFNAENDWAAQRQMPQTPAMARGFAVYRHNMQANLTGALRDIYPVIYRILGAALFASAAKEYVLQQPSLSGDLNDFGSAWANFLQTHTLTRELPYLPDIARMEHAWHIAFHAADYPLFDFDKLAQVSPAQLAHLRFILHPSVHLIKSGYPLLQIWQVNQPDYLGDMTINWNTGHCILLLARRGYDVEIRSCSSDIHVFLAALMEKQNLQQAVEAACNMNPQFDLQQQLFSLIQTGIIVDFAEERSS